jgi:hypothetical protein
MSWLISGLLALLVLSVVAFVAPAVFGPTVAGAAPVLFAIAVVGLAAIWWRATRGRQGRERP